MKETINRKIEEIRRKPEHVRVRYVFVFVALSMTLVVLLWIISIQANLSSLNHSEETETADFLLDSKKKEFGQIETLQEALDQSREIFERGSRREGADLDSISPEVGRENI